MNADLVLEGGGVKGIGLVGALSSLEKAGYSFSRVAGTSAGAITGALIAAGMSADEMEAVMRELDYFKFQDESFLDKLGHLGKGLSVIFEKGIYEGNYLREWLSEQLKNKGIETFADLRLPEDPESTIPRERAYKLVVMASDITHGRLVRLPWDYPRYGLDPDEQRVADAVRASMSIPIFFEPVRLDDKETGNEAVLVDGGMLSNFPIGAFDRTDGRAPRWPTFGIKLSARPPEQQVLHECTGVVDLMKALIGTMTSAHDRMHLDDSCVLSRTMFIDTFQVKATDFDLDDATQEKLYENGLRAGKKFLQDWDFDAYIEKCRGPSEES